MAQYVFDYLLPNNYQLSYTLNNNNFGMIEFNWGKTKEESSVFLGVYDINKVLFNQIEIFYKDVIFSNTNNNDIDCEVRFNSRLKPFEEYIWYYIYYPISAGFYICSPLIIIYLIKLNWLSLSLFSNILKTFVRLFAKGK